MSNYKSPDRDKIRYELVATDGDCAAGGMGDTNSRLPVRNKHLPLVMEFLRSDLEITLACASEVLTGRLDASTWDRNLRDKHNLLAGALLDLDVLKHKWHLRTSWRLSECLNEYESLPDYCKRSGIEATAQ